LDKTNNKIAVIGDRDSVTAFKALGLEIFPDTNPFAMRETIRKLAQSRYAVILITEKAAGEIPDVIAKYRASAYPVITVIPAGTGTTGLGIQGLKKDIEKAIGTDVIFK